MALPQGLNFRATAGYVTDGTNEDNEIGIAVNYPRTSAQGNTVGWETVNGASENTRDRNASNDRRLAGMAFDGSPVIDTYRIDLPATGNYNVRVAAGDASYAQPTKVELFDTTTSLGVLCSGSTGAANSFKDAANATYTAANWPGSNTAASVTFASTICRFKNGDGASSCMIAHVYVESAGGAAAATRIFFPTSLSGVGSGGVFRGDRLQ